MRPFLKEKKSKISSFFKSPLRFLSLRYSADFRRSRLVHKNQADNEFQTNFKLIVETICQQYA